jgi:hypothetical protein
MAKKKSFGVNWTYFIGVLLLFGIVAALRSDLTLEVLARAQRIFMRGGTARLRIILEGGLLLSILAGVARFIAISAAPKRDAVMFAVAAVLGWVAEAWGTRSGLWHYYTGETPPLWIVPAWPLGALVIDRLARKWQQRAAKNPPAWAAPFMSATALIIFIAFAHPAWSSATTWILASILAAALFYKPPPEQFFILAAGIVCVFFADFWGTSSQCWSYYIETPAWPTRLAGISFGMFFDTAVIVGAVRLGRRY